jgi:single-strand DNA-binding protein
MATVFETRLIGNIGRDATIKTMDRGVIAINFPVAHNKNWRDKRTGETKTKTTWVNCTIWKKDGSTQRILDFLKKGALVELEGTPFAKAYAQEDGTIRTEIRLNVSRTNILRPVKCEDENCDDLVDSDESNLSLIHI